MLGAVNIPPIVFVLNKTDLPAHKWQVTINNVAEKISKCLPDNNQNAFITCSAALNENVTKVLLFFIF